MKVEEVKQTRRIAEQEAERYWPRGCEWWRKTADIIEKRMWRDAFQKQLEGK